MIWDICIRRPVFTCMLVLAPVVLGLASYGRLGVELFTEVGVQHNNSIAQGAPTPLDETAGLTVPITHPDNPFPTATSIQVTAPGRASSRPPVTAFPPSRRTTRIPLLGRGARRRGPEERTIAWRAAAVWCKRAPCASPSSPPGACKASSCSRPACGWAWPACSTASCAMRPFPPGDGRCRCTWSCRDSARARA